MTDVIELELVEETPLDIDIDYNGEYVSGATGEEYQKGYNEGYGKGYTEGETQGFENGLEQGFEDGKNSVTDYAKYADAISFDNLNVFGKPIVELNLDNVTTLKRFIMGNETNTTVEHLIVNCGKQIESMVDFYNNSSLLRDTVLKHITLNVDTSKVTGFTNGFAWLVALEEIKGQPLDFSSIDTSKSYINNNIFSGYNNALKEVRFVENSIPFSIWFNACPNLSPETIQSIIDGLADLTGQTAQTVSWYSTVLAKLTPEQYSQMINKNWNWN